MRKQAASQARELHGAEPSAGAGCFAAPLHEPGVRRGTLACVLDPGEQGGVEEAPMGERYPMQVLRVREGGRAPDF